MISAAIPEKESERLKSLHSYKILDTLPEKDFDDITKLASLICNTPISSISLIDADRQWFKSSIGFSTNETPRDIAFCAHAILTPEKIFEVEDSSKDLRFHDNPLVTGDPHIIFYAGMPLVNSDGQAIGILCVIDNKPKKLSEQQHEALRVLGRQVIAQLELRRKIAEMESLQTQTEEGMEELNKFAYVVSHDLKAPLNGIIALLDELKEDYSQKFDEHGIDLVDMIKGLSNKLVLMIKGILEYSRASNTTISQHESIHLNEILNEVADLLHIPSNFKLSFNNSDHFVTTSKIALQQILLNLFCNAVKYNDKSDGTIQVDFSEDGDYYYFSVKDNGPGIPEQHHEKIFELFQTLNKVDRFHVAGTGIGLSTVKKLVERLGGNISIESKQGEGTMFIFNIKK